MQDGHEIVQMIPNTTDHRAVFEVGDDLDGQGVIAFWALCGDGRVRGFYGDTLECPEDSANFRGYMPPRLFERERILHRAKPDGYYERQQSAKAVP